VAPPPVPEAGPVSRPSAAVRRPRAVIAAFSITLFASAGLLFLVQPMLARFLLPLYGSSPAVWTTSLLFFQATLLAGYAYAHVSVRRLGVRRAAAAHLVLVAAGLVALPIGLPDGLGPAAGAGPVASLLVLLAVSAGLPFFVVSSTAPLLQRWLAGTDHPDAGDPYFLYRASNVGSLLGLLAYPFAIEPTLALADQGRAWATGYALLAALLLACAALVWRAPARPPAEAERVLAAEPGAPLDNRRRARWVALALVPSSLVLGVTSFLTTDLAPVPLLWVVPLGLYLLTFVLAFSPGRTGRLAHRVIVAALPLAAVGLALILVFEPREPLWLLLLVHLGAFFVLASVCHGELAADRPPARHLTEFYLWVAVGGVLGGALNALLAPVVFEAFTEYPLALVLACLLWPGVVRRGGRRVRPLDVAGPLVLGVGLAFGLRALGDADHVGPTVLLALAVGVLAWFALRPVRFGLGVAALLVGGTLGLGDGDRRLLYGDRNFFGAHEVVAEGGLNRLVHGTTLHGSQAVGEPGPPTPTSYYHPGSPVAQVLDALPDRSLARRTAVIGLGTGTLACYARAGEEWTFFELDPKVQRIARDPRLFTYLRDCEGSFRVVLGDARLSLQRAPRARFGIIVADAFSSDAIPTHLVTREAVSLYRSRLAPWGLLIFHISNRYLDLDPVLGSLARDAGLACRTGRADSPSASTRHSSNSTWVVMARRPRNLGRIAGSGLWAPCGTRRGARVWTDDYSNVLAVVRRGP
jgi:hypothetical protein